MSGLHLFEPFPGEQAGSADPVGHGTEKRSNFYSEQDMAILIRQLGGVKFIFILLASGS